MRKTRWISIVLAFCVAAVIACLEHERAVYFLTPHLETSDASTDHPTFYKLGRFMQDMEWAAYDVRFRWRGKRAPSPDVVIIAVDEASLKEFHQWPWPRSIHAHLIDTLKNNPPKALLFDIFFIDPFTSDPAGDRALVRATAAAPWVAHSLFLSVQGNTVHGGQTPFPALGDVAHQVGSVNALLDEDGVLRAALLEMPVDDMRVPLLSLVGAGLARGEEPVQTASRVPVDHRGRMLVDFVGPAFSFPYYSYADVLDGRVPASTFAGKVVLVGASATGTYDHYPTPLAATMPGVEFHANVIDNLLSQRGLRPAGLRWTYGSIVFFGLLCGLVLAALSARIGALWAFIALLVYGGTVQWLFVKHRIVLDMAGPLATLILGYLTVVVYRFFAEEKEKRLVRAFFSQQVSGELLDALLGDPSILRRAGERREMTVFFSDVAGFTSISERLQPEEVVSLLNEYLTAMTEVVFRHGGYVDKYMGDGVMAFWNGILRQPDHAARACQCALESMRELEKLNTALVSRKLIPLSARIGINTGPMAAGYMGSSQKKQYTVMGDHVNTASRLEGANKMFGTSIMISEFTYEIVQDQFEVRFLDRVRVPGKGIPVKTYELLSEKGALSIGWRQALPVYHEAIQCYADRQFSQAGEKFLEVLAVLGHDKVSEAYLQRAEFYVSKPPPKEWDGILEIKTK